MSRERDAAEQVIAIGFRELAASQCSGGRTLNMGATVGQGLVGHLDRDDAVAAAGDYLGNAGAHRAQADDSDGADLMRHGLILPLI